jgi:subfamily B ATP-binding cassette protein MsbA
MEISLKREALETYKRLWGYVKPYKLIGFIALMAMIGTALIEMTMVALIEPLMDEALVAKNIEATRWLPIAFIAVFLLRGISGFATEASLGWIGRGVISSLRREVFEKFLKLPVKFFEKNSNGRILSKMTYNVEMISESVTNVVTILIRDILTVIAAIGLMIYQSPRLFVSVVVIFPVITILINFLGKVFRRYSERIQDSVGEVTQVTQEVLSGQRIVKIFDGYDFEMNRINEVDEKNRLQNIKLIRSRSLGVAITQVVFGVGVAAVIYFAGNESINGNLSPGSFMSFFGAMMLMLQPIRRITNVNAVLQRGIAASESLFSVLDEPAEKDQGVLENLSSKGTLEFKKVTFSYDDKANKDVISGISFIAKKGQSVAIVGHSGSGKSTLINLLPRFYDYQHGEILIDGVSIKDFKIKNLREKISIVNQDIILFNDTILNNLTYGELKHKSEIEIQTAIELAKIDQFTSEFPKGLDTIVGDRGAMLSGGQKQRIAIGRAILKNSPFLLLDEATSSLDTKSESQIQEALKELMKNRTTLVVAHRLSTIENADLILVLHNGEIIERGTHNELIERGEHYADLHRLQFKSS